MAFCGRTILAFAALCGVAAAAAPAGASGVEVDVELVLAVDTSNSMAADEQTIQRAGYVEAIASTEVIAAIEVGLIGRIAVSYLEWGEAGRETVVVDWHVIEDRESAEIFAEKLAAAPIGQRRRTSISGALTFAADMIETNDFEGLRKVIDVSGDGPNNHGGPVLEAREATLRRGIVVNGLPVMIDDGRRRWSVVQELDVYYETCVIGGPSAFLIPVRSKADFAHAIRRKLVLEIAGLAPDTYRLIPASARGGPEEICTAGERSAALR